MAAVSLIVLVLALVYWFPLRRWFVCWGSTAADRTRVMAGDSGENVPPTQPRWTSPSTRARNGSGQIRDPPTTGAFEMWLCSAF